MKFKLLFLIFLICISAFGQDYKSIIAEANNLYNKKEYKKSVLKYKEAFKFDQKNTGDLYDASCSASLAGKKKLALKWLNYSVDNGWINLNHLQADNDLVALHSCKEWNNLLLKIRNNIDKIEANYDRPLQAKLLSIFEDDQEIRRKYISAQKEFGYQSKQVDSLGKIMMFKDSINLSKITEILDKYGWVSIDKVGGQANHTLFLVIQHADLKTQQKYLPMMRDAVKNKNANSKSLALLEDRVLLGEGKKQIYGSQIGYDNVTGKNYILPLDDPDNVDKRRAEAGLGPIADYVKQWNIIWNIEEYKKLLSDIENQLKNK